MYDEFGNWIGDSGGWIENPAYADPALFQEAWAVPDYSWDQSMWQGIAPTGDLTNPGGTVFSGLANWLGGTGGLGSLLTGMNATAGGTPSNLSTLLTGAGGTAASLYSSAVQQAAARDAIELQKQQFAQNQANLQPWLTAGQASLSKMVTDPALTAHPNLTLDQFNYNPNNYFTSPAYQAMMQSGQQAIDASAAKSGNWGSGNQMADLQKLGMQVGAQYQQQDYNQQKGLYDTEAARRTQLYNAQQGNLTNAQNYWRSLAGLGQGAANQIGAWGQQAAQDMGNTGISAAQAGAGGVTGAVNALTGMVR